MSDQRCTVDGCKMRYRSRGLCFHHKRIFELAGVELPDFRSLRNTTYDPCSVGDCDGPAKYRRLVLCEKHYLHYWKYGRAESTTIDERLAQRIVEKPSGCWEWCGQMSSNGYGRMNSRYAHRVVYEHFVGPIAEGLQIDHLCRNRACVNPKHLEPVTQRENLRRQALHMTRDSAGRLVGKR